MRHCYTNVIPNDSPIVILNASEESVVRSFAYAQDDKNKARGTVLVTQLYSAKGTVLRPEGRPRGRFS